MNDREQTFMNGTDYKTNYNSNLTAAIGFADASSFFYANAFLAGL